MIQLQTFGALELRRDNAVVRSVLSQPKRLALLVHLLLDSPSGHLSRDVVLARFWPESDDERARNALRQALHYLRRSLGDDVIVNRGDREIGCGEAAVQCDAVRFESALRDGCYEDALALYRGDFLPGFFVDDAPEIERWIDDRRGAYRREALRVAGELAERAAAAGELHAAALWARRATAIGPHDEAAARRLIELLAACGEAAAALLAYDEFAARLAAELEIAPSEATRRVAASIRAAAGRSTAADAAADVVVDETAGSVAARAAADAAAAAGRADAAPNRTAASGAVVDRLPAHQAAPAAVTLSVRGGRRRLVQLAAAVLVLLAGVAGWQVRSLNAVPEAAPAVAVLPFTNLSGDAAHEYFSDGLAEELLNVLGRVPGLKVAARTSSFSFRGKDVAIDSVARALGVTHVVEGSVRVDGTRFRIAVQLVEAATGFHVWGDAFDAQLGDIVTTQAQIARAIARSLQVELSPALAAPLPSETRDPEAYRLVLRAAQVMRGGSTRAVLGEAAALLEEAVRLDPAYPRALAALANVLSWQATWRYIEPDSGYARAQRLAERAAAAAPIVEAHLVLARHAENVAWDTAAADAHYRRALEIDPLDPRALQFRALFLGRVGRVDEGVAAAKRAIELDPLHPGAHNNLAVVLLAGERHEDARAAYEEALRVAPEDPIILGNLANLAARLERWDDAIAYLDRSLVRMPDDAATRSQRASILLRAGRRDEGLAMLRAFEADPAFPRYSLARLYSNVGDVERILDLLEQAVERREDQVPSLRNPETFRGMREHPRFVRLLERIGG